MGKTSKAIFLGLCIIGSFLIYCVYYYSNMVKNAPFRFSDFEYVSIQYGHRDSMFNTYNSATQAYSYINAQKAVVDTTLKLNDDDLLYIHRKAMEMGLWNVDDDMTTPREDSTQALNIPRFIIEFKYKDKSKRVVVDTDYPGHRRMLDATMTTVETVIETVNRAYAR